MSTIAVIGSTGYVGGHITSEALRRGHQVIGVSRSQPTVSRVGVTVRRGDITDKPLLRELASEASTVVIAVHGVQDGESFLAALVPSMLDAASSGGARLGVVGGAASLLVTAGGPRLIDTPEFPEIFMVEARSHIAVLEALRSSTSDADWFYVSPPATFGAYAPGERTGRYRTGDDILLSDAQGNSSISGADFAIAFVDEIETPVHHRARFTVGY
jgi:putative NADH-flavin reductase